jgi:hypothetical protein
LNRNSVFSDFCTKSFVATKPIYPTHHIIGIPLFAVLSDLFCSLACFRPTDCRVESKLPENLQDINFEDLEQQQAGFEGKCP